MHWYALAFLIDHEEIWHIEVETIIFVAVEDCLQFLACLWDALETVENVPAWEVFCCLHRVCLIKSGGRSV